MHLMTALAAAGDRARALERASAYQRQVRSELEAEPNPAVLALARLLRGEAAVRPVTFGVLPLAAPGGGPEAQGLAEGLTEELTSAAAELPGLRVASGTSLAAARRATQDVRQIGARLGLAAVLEGSVRLAAGRVRVAVRLVDVADGCHCWSGRYERVLDAGFETQVALARGVVEAIRPQLVRLAGPGSVTPDTPDGQAGTSP
jgi:TolB-like protein